LPMLNIGPFTTENVRAFVRIGSRDLVAVEMGRDGQLLLTIDVYAPDGEHVAKLRRNAWAFNKGDSLVLATQSELRLFDKATEESLIEVEVVGKDVIYIRKARIQVPGWGPLTVTAHRVELPNGLIYDDSHGGHFFIKNYDAAFTFAERPPA
jgi:hypothetical protein